jgi:hypothetical protein
MEAVLALRSSQEMVGEVRRDRLVAALGREPGRARQHASAPTALSMCRRRCRRARGAVEMPTALPTRPREPPGGAP